MKYLTGTQYKSAKPWSTWHYYRHLTQFSQIMKYLTGTQYKSAKPWSTWHYYRHSIQFSQTMKYLTGTQYKTTKATIPKSQEIWLEDWYRLISFVSHTTQQHNQNNSFLDWCMPDGGKAVYTAVQDCCTFSTDCLSINDLMYTHTHKNTPVI